MTIHFTSDTHFNHRRVIGYSSRPFHDVHEMNEHLIQNWNRCVQPGDDIYHLGDFAFGSIGNFDALLSRLNGNIHVILGNHDKVIEKNRAHLLEKGKIKSIQHHYELKHDGQVFVLYHYGCRVWHWSYRGTIHLYGHSHGRLPPFGRSMDVGVDSTVITSEYRPISIKEVIKFMENRPFGFESDDQARKALHSSIPGKTNVPDAQ